MDFNEKLRNLLREKSKTGFAIVSVYDADTTKKNRKNTKRSRILENLIIQNKIPHKTIIINKPHGEKPCYFILFASQAIEEKALKMLIEQWSRIDYFPVFNISYDLESLIKDRKFYHPVRKAEKEEAHKKYEIILEDLFEPPEQVGEWKLREAADECYYLYFWEQRSNILCAVCKQSNGKWKKSYGGYIPCGFNIKTDFAASREEALSSFSIEKK